MDNQKTIGNYKIHLDDERGDFIELYSSREEEGIAIMRKHGIKNVTLWERSYHILNLEKLLPFIDDIEGIWLFGKYNTDLLPLFVNIKCFAGNLLSENKIDFSKFKSLEYLYITWNGKKFYNFDSLIRLKKLILDSFSESNLDIFNSFKLLEDLRLYDSKINSLKGIGELKNLNFFLSYQSNKLNNLGDINETESLETLWFVKTALISDYSKLTSLVHLKKLGLVDVGAIPDLHFLNKLKNLSSLTIRGTVVNGDVSACIGIEDLDFNNKSHYSHKLKEIQVLTKQKKSNT